ncbi:MAG: ATP-binding cassette domain-containing protein [Holophagales bacterium]|nr:ATP-binding cassette domain-containing protein [Holophagales bacterium]
MNLVTGVAGAGKTSLLAAAVERLRIDGPFPRIVTVDADPIGRTPRSNPATYTGAFDHVRDLFAATPRARALGFGKGHFSFNTAGGRCESCEGAGVHEVGMRYLGSVDLVCDACAGRRFHPDVLAVRLDGQSIADVLAGSIEAAAGLFRGHGKLARILDALVDLGLGYLPLGQSATTLSGGEAQRIKLATELAKATSPALVVLDEPTIGLHAADVTVLVTAFRRLSAGGHTLLVADHDLGLVRGADRITEIGPGSGPDGGRVVVAGTVAEIAACPEAPTGAALRGEFGIRPAVDLGAFGADRAGTARRLPGRERPSRAHRRHDPQPPRRDGLVPSPRLHRRDGPLGFREVLPRLRHAPGGIPGALRRSRLSLGAPFPPDARRRPARDRPKPEARGGRPRAAGTAKPADDRRNGDRDRRAAPPPLRPGRLAAVSPMRAPGFRPGVRVRGEARAALGRRLLASLRARRVPAVPGARFRPGLRPLAPRDTAAENAAASIDSRPAGPGSPGSSRPSTRGSTRTSVARSSNRSSSTGAARTATENG